MNTIIHKSDTSGPCFELVPIQKKKPAALRMRCDLLVIVGDKFVKLAGGTSIDLPPYPMVAGTDYSVLVTSAGRLTVSELKPAAGVTQIGGFHFAPGGNAPARSGGNNVPQINPHSLWDQLWRPTCPDPRGMALVALQDGRKIWVDIYLCSTTGESRYGATIADGSSHAKIPAAFGGDGSAEYDGLNNLQAVQLAAGAGKTLLTRAEYEQAAYGVLEKTSAERRAEIAGLDAPRTSKWGLMQASGQRYVWGQMQLLQEFSALDVDRDIGTHLFGGDWSHGVSAGSRSCVWYVAPSASNNGIGARFRCDHLCPV